MTHLCRIGGLFATLVGGDVPGGMRGTGSRAQYGAVGEPISISLPAEQSWRSTRPVHVCPSTWCYGDLRARSTTLPSRHSILNDCEHDSQSQKSLPNVSPCASDGEDGAIVPVEAQTSRRIVDSRISIPAPPDCPPRFCLDKFAMAQGLHFLNNILGWPPLPEGSDEFLSLFPAGAHPHFQEFSLFHFPKNCKC